MINNLRINKLLWIITTVLSLFVATVGVIQQNIYDGLVISKYMAGTITQDIMTIIISIIALVIIFIMKEKNIKMQIIIIGIMSYIFYAYGIYVIEQLYNMYYLIYMAIFGLSIYSIIYTLVSIKKEVLKKVALPNIVRYIAVVFALLIAIIFNIIWTLNLLPLLQTGDKIEQIYSIYILDLCIIMPAYIILAIKCAKKEGFGLLLIPALFILGFSMLLPVGLGELLQPYYNYEINFDGLMFFLSLSIIFLIISILYLFKLKIKEE